ncbi:VOC family protein [Nocardia sp. NPDC088792]|uniref:VOC family protein n=1 Tax=Nocardia sp. NPDC088792 TaxID=3364332 RepID=UPI003826E892
MTVKVNVIQIVVSDMAASIAFYERLGVEFPPGSASEPHVDTQLGGGVRLLFDTEETIRSFMPEWERPTSPGRLGLAAECESPAAVDAKFEELIAAGYEAGMKPWDAFWGQHYAVVHDPDGNGVDLYAAL